MPKYILHGGNLREENDFNKQFFAELERNFNEGDSVLLCFFAPSCNSNRSAEEKFEIGVELFKKNIKKNINYIFAEKKRFIEQLRKSDILYLHGGDTDGLFEALKQYPEFIEEIKKKRMVIGSSAGAYVLSEYSIDRPGKSEVKKRFGVLPIKIYCHFDEKYREILEEKFLQVDEEGKFENVFLRNGEMKIFDN